MRERFSVQQKYRICQGAFGLGFYCYRSKLRDVTAGAVQIAALAQTGQKLSPPDTLKTGKP